MMLFCFVVTFEINIAQEFGGFIFSDLKTVTERLLVYFSPSGNNSTDIEKNFQLVNMTNLRRNIKVTLFFTYINFIFYRYNSYLHHMQTFDDDRSVC